MNKQQRRKRRQRIRQIKFVVIAGVLTAVVVGFACRKAPAQAEEEKPVETVEAPVVEAPLTRHVQTVEAVEVLEPVVYSKEYFDVPLDYELQDHIAILCEEHHIEPAVLVAMIDRETDFRADAIGDNGKAFGLLQVQPRWHQERMDKLGITDLLDPVQNVTVAVDYLAELISHDKGLEWAVAAYNAGPTGASKGLGSGYAKEVLENSEKLKEGMVQVFYSDDPARDFARHDAEQERLLEALPQCADCEHHIQDEKAYYINGEWICKDCMSSYERDVMPE